MWPTLFTLAAAGCVFLLCAAVWLWTQRQALRQQRDRTDDDLTHANRQVDSLRQAYADLDKQHAEQRAKHEGLDDKFKALANDVLKQSNEQFLQLAKKTFDGEQKDAAAQLEQRKQAIESLIKPIRESLDKHSKAVADSEKDRKQDQGSLRQQLMSMVQSQKQLESETKWLANALRQSGSVQGRWGELSLKRIAEMAGMIEHCDFDDQVTIWTGDKSQRPDMVVNLPSDRLIIVDAKAPMSGYLDAINADNDQDRDRFLAQHLMNVEERVTELVRKDYSQHLSAAADFVVLFIPGDSFLSPAVQKKPGLIESALARGVAIATPTTLICLLRVVELGWRETRLAENAQRVSELGGELHARIAVVVEHLAAHQKSLQGTFDSFGKLVGSVEKYLIPGARKLKNFGVDSSKELPTVSQIEIPPRKVKQPISE